MVSAVVTTSSSREREQRQSLSLQRERGLRLVALERELRPVYAIIYPEEGTYLLISTHSRLQTGVGYVHQIQYVLSLSLYVAYLSIMGYGYYHGTYRIMFFFCICNQKISIIFYYIIIYVRQNSETNNFLNITL